MYTGLHVVGRERVIVFGPTRVVLHAVEIDDGVIKFDANRAYHERRSLCGTVVKVHRSRHEIGPYIWPPNRTDLVCGFCDQLISRHEPGSTP